MHRRLSVVIAIAALVAAACSSKPTATTSTGPPSGPASSPSPSVALTRPPGPVVTITLVNFSFQPTTIVASTSQAIKLVNNGTVPHNFTIVGTGIDVDTQPGQTTNLEAPGSSFQPGTYQVFCKFHKSMGMVATLIAVAG